MAMRMLLVAGLMVAADAAYFCELVESTYKAEYKRIRSCSTASECGQVLPLGCGCTRNPVARKDASTRRLDFLRGVANKLECELPSTVTICDCPPADGFACLEGQCEWNLLSAPLPLPVPVPVPVPQPPTNVCQAKPACGGATDAECKVGTVCLQDPDVECTKKACPSCCVENQCMFAKCSLGYFCRLNRLGHAECVPDKKKL